jgi:hypothetical protein
VSTWNEIEQLQADRKSDRRWTKWRERAAHRLPDLAARVFALNGRAYDGSVFHYTMIGRLGRVITEVGDPTRPYEGRERFTSRLITQLALEELLVDVRAAETSAQAISGERQRGGHAG